MKAILVNAVERTVKEVELGSDYREINRFIGCRCFTVARYLDKGDAVFADDEGLLHNPRHFVEIGAYPEPIAGNLLIVGSTPDGDSTDCKSHAKDIDNDVVFLDIATVLSRLG
jgi:hypothetical protein